MTTTFIVERENLTRAGWVRSEGEALTDGAVRMAIDAFALTSNNITSAAFGDAMNYWGFFPTGDAATGGIPVWGFANVVESRCPGVAVGERYHGYFPIASDVVLQPEHVDATGFFDGASHRRELHAVYNQYSRCSADPGYVAAREAEQALLRPLFITSFLIDDFLADHAYFGARAAVLSSASSKTAYGTAFCLARRRGVGSAGDAHAVKNIGLTSPGNVAFTERLGCYDQVLAYDATSHLPADVPTVYVDFSGSVAVRAGVHRHLAERLMYSCSVGGTHWEALGSGEGLPGPRPAQVQKRSVDWGAAGLQQRIAGAWAAFMQPVTDPLQPWLQVVRGRGAAAVETAYAALLAGTVDPAQGHVLSVS